MKGEMQLIDALLDLHADARGGAHDHDEYGQAADATCEERLIALAHVATAPCFVVGVPV